MPYYNHYNLTLQKALESALTEQDKYPFSFYVKLICQNPFVSDICIALYWTKFTFQWERITLPTDINNNVLNTLTGKKEDKEIALILHRETGQNEIELLQPLLSKLQKLTIPIDLQLDRQLGRDGDGFKLTLGNEYSYTTCYWAEYSSTPAWQDLTDFANTILSINKQLIASKKKQ
ncbi:hypothetical protein ACE193_11980 [Bernardetia sp. OM2101]|uniref:hypothetical protein n=1 Tax=Bernardetia sp. OM2101 TaxID=3344876 RepID=UPI0035CF07BD